MAAAWARGQNKAVAAVQSVEMNGIRKSRRYQRGLALAAATGGFIFMTCLGPMDSLDMAIFLSGLTVIYGVTIIAIGRGVFDWLLFGDADEPPAGQQR
jgi:hypothetical protein